MATGTISEIGARLCNEDNIGAISRLWLVDIKDVLSMKRLDWAAVWLKQMSIKTGARLWSIPIHQFGGCVWNENRADTIDGFKTTLSINFGLPKQKADRLTFIRTQSHKRWVAVGQDYNGQIFVSDNSGHGLRMDVGWGTGSKPSEASGVAFSLTGVQNRFSWMSESWESVLDGLIQIPIEVVVPPIPIINGAWILKTILLTNMAQNDWQWTESVIADTETVFVNGVVQKRGLDYLIDYEAKNIVFLTDDGWPDGVVWMKAAVSV